RPKLYSNRATPGPTPTTSSLRSASIPHQRATGREANMSAASLAMPRQPTPKPGGWINHIPPAFIPSAINPRLGWFLLVLDDLSGDRSYGITSNARLSPLLADCSEDTIGRLFKAAEQEGWLRRAFIPGSHGRATGRVGFVWFRRPSSLPT